MMHTSTLQQQIPDVVPVKDLAAQLIEKIRTRDAHIGVVGLGYVGLPLALEAAAAGFPVLGIDVNRAIVDGLRDGRSHVLDVTDTRLGEALAAGNFIPSTEWGAIGELDVVIVCVPTPLRKTGDPDLTYVMAATEALASRIDEGTLVVLESTTYPGTTEEVLLPRLQALELEVGRDLFLAFSPERVDPGNREYGAKNIPKVVGGVTPKCAEIAATLYGQWAEKVVTVSSTRVAEMVKLLENTFRSVNIALVNEMAMMCAHMGIDVWEVIDAAASKPFGFMPFYPGPGLGGHCIPIDPIYLRWKSRIDGFEPQFIDLAERVNGEMPLFVARRSMELLNERGKAMRGSRVHVMGVAYKRNVSDIRESPALRIIAELQGFGAKVSYSDPFVPRLPLGEATLVAEEPSPQVLEATDLVVIVTDHAAFDYPLTARHAPLLFDTRNATKGIEADHVFRL